MQITLNQDEIHEAVTNYINSQVNLADDQDISIDFTAGRGANGLSATIDIRSRGSIKAKAAPKPAAAPVAKTEEPKEDTVTAEVEETAEEVKEEKPASKGKLFAAKASTTDDDADDEPDAVEAKLPASSIFAKTA